jgi:hypothetical protein
MRRYLFTALAVLALAAVVPVASMARSDNGKREHARGDRHREHAGNRRHARHHRRRHDRVEHFRAHGAQAGGQPADAGTIQSFKSGNVLTISLADGSTASGVVTKDTEVECQAMSTGFSRHDGGPGPSGGDNSGRGDGNDQGDDNGDQAGDNDQGDDNGAAADNDPGDDNGAAENDADDDNGAPGQPASSCAMALRTPGTHVRDATLRLTASGPVWERVELDG